MKIRNRRGNSIDKRQFVLSAKNLVNMYLTNNSSVTSDITKAKVFNGYITAKDYRRLLQNPKDWLIEGQTDDT